MSKNVLIGQIWRSDEYPGWEVLMTKTSRDSVATGQLISNTKQNSVITQGQR